MKTAVSIPNPIFEAAERLAAQLGLSRSALYAEALKEFTEARARVDLESAMNKALEEAWGDDGDPGLDEDARLLQARTLARRSEW
jgi:hypothetical protein